MLSTRRLGEQKCDPSVEKPTMTRERKARDKQRSNDAAELHQSYIKDEDSNGIIMVNDDWVGGSGH